MVKPITNIKLAILKLVDRFSFSEIIQTLMWALEHKINAYRSSHKNQHADDLQRILDKLKELF